MVVVVVEVVEVVGVTICGPGNTRPKVFVLDPWLLLTVTLAQTVPVIEETPISLSPAFIGLPLVMKISPHILTSQRQLGS
jgi:hypothetical protein